MESHRSVQVHRRAGEHEDVVPGTGQIPDGQAAEVQEVAAVPSTVAAEGQAWSDSRDAPGVQLEDDGPAAQDRPSQADEDAVLQRRKSLDVRAVVLAGLGQERRQVAVGGPRIRQTAHATVQQRCVRAGADGVRRRADGYRCAAVLLEGKGEAG
jgi:hypothetical protein